MWTYRPMLSVSAVSVVTWLSLSVGANFPFEVRVPVTGLGPTVTHDGLILTCSHLPRSWCKYSHIPRCPELGFEHVLLGRPKSTPNDNLQNSASTQDGKQVRGSSFAKPTFKHMMLTWNQKPTVPPRGPAQLEEADGDKLTHCPLLTQRSPPRPRCLSLLVSRPEAMLLAL